MIRAWLAGWVVAVLGAVGVPSAMAQSQPAAASAPGQMPCWSPSRNPSFETIWEPDAPPTITVLPGQIAPLVEGETALPTNGSWSGQPVMDPVFPGIGQYPADDGPADLLEPWATVAPWFKDLSVFAGVHGFKGPLDRGRNGNFGFHEGANLGGPLGIFEWGYQIGMEAVHSNLSGDQAVESRSDVRNQFFFTGGIFHRQVDWGFQWGLTYDWLHDAYYAQADLKQIRSDTSFLLPGGMRELGYFGAYGTGGSNFVLIGRQAKYYVVMEPTDVFALYYRRYFEGGGDGRFWLGLSGRGDGILGAELRVPMGHNWALENRMNYLIPKQGRGVEAALQESWGVTIQLVWYPGQPARCVRSHPYRPMLAVADNTLFMTDTFVPAGAGL